MSKLSNIVNEIEGDLESAKSQRSTLLTQLSLLDVNIDEVDSLVVNIDRDALPFLSKINDAINKVKIAYDNRISSKCRNNLYWELTSTFTIAIRATSGSGGGLLEFNVNRYTVKKNPELYRYLGYHGIKYYSYPSNRDYGTSIVASFNGNIGVGESVIGINYDGLSTDIILKDLKIGDTIVDDIDNPTIFSLSSLPKIVGFGTTSSVGIVSTLTGIMTSGSNIFYHVGPETLVGIETGNLLINSGILTTGTSIVGIGTSVKEIEYFNEVGILTTTELIFNTLELSNSAFGDSDSDKFSVGIVTSLPAIFISTTSLQETYNTNFVAIREDAEASLDVKLDQSPTNPVKIGTINNQTLGVGSSVFFTNNGDPNITVSWNTSSERDRITYTFNNTTEVVQEEVREPKVGAGRAEYYIGDFEWPVKRTFSLLGFVSQTYANEGDVRTTFGLIPSIGIGTTSIPPGGFPTNCSQYDQAILDAEAELAQVISENGGKSQSLIDMTKGLRKYRTKKELEAWGMSQAITYLEEEAIKLEDSIRAFNALDLSAFET
jgi:hypothetical protein